MESKVNYAVIGFFVLVLGAALIGITLWLSAGKFERVTYDTYLAYTSESVSGLSVNAPVKYRGVEVGKVRDIALDPDNPEQVRLRLEIERGTPVKEDTVATLSSQGLTGIAFVDLTGGSRDSPLLRAKPGVQYPVITTGPSLLTRVDTALTNTLANVNALIVDLHALADPQNRAAIRNILANVESISKSLASYDARFRAGLDHAVVTLDHTAEASAELPQLLASMRHSAESIEEMAGALKQAGVAVNRTVQRSHGELESFADQTLPDAALLVDELRTLSATLQRVGQQLEQDPTMLLYGKRAQPRGPGE